jgi:hypothetical protein
MAGMGAKGFNGRSGENPSTQYWFVSFCIMVAYINKAILRDVSI